MVNKKKTLIKHARRRASERHAIDLHQDLLAGLVRQIERGEAEFISRQSKRVTKWWVTTPKGQRMPVVYDKDRKTIITVLALSHVEAESKGSQIALSTSPSSAGKR